jgi:hypothetical protein
MPESEPNLRESADSTVPPGGGFRVRTMAMAPVLLVGAPRSGTTWLQRTLLSLPECCGGQESHALCTVAKVVEDFDRKAAMERPHGLAAHLTRPELIEQMRCFWLATMTPSIAAAPTAVRLLEKTPDHAVHLDLARELLPEARVIHLVRDPCDVVASLMSASRRSWGAGWAPATVESATSRWIECVDAAEASGARFDSGRFLTIRYEDLQRDPRTAFTSILRLLELPMDRVEALKIASESGGAEIPLFGQLAERSSEEPAGFLGGSTPLGPWARRKVMRLVGNRYSTLGVAPRSGS